MTAFPKTRSFLVEQGFKTKTWSAMVLVRYLCIRLLTYNLNATCRAVDIGGCRYALLILLTFVVLFRVSADITVRYVSWQRR